MSTLAFQRAGWSIQVSRSSRHFCVSWATGISRKNHTQNTPINSRPSPISTLVRAERTQARSFHAVPNFRQEARAVASQPPVDTVETTSLTSGLNDEPLILDEGSRQVDWSRSFHGLSTEAFPKEVADILLAPLDPEDIEVKPDGLLYLPEIKYRRILNRAFGPGAWGLAPRGETIITSKSVTREYALVAHGRLISVARGEQDYFAPENIPTATEGCKSNALMRCCKDLGVASELWDPRFIRTFVKAHVREVWVEHIVSKKKKKISLRKDQPPPSIYKLVN